MLYVNTVNTEKHIWMIQLFFPVTGILISGTHQSNPEKLRASETIESPKTKPALKSALGRFNYYRDYIRNYAAIVMFLIDLTKKKVPEIILWFDGEEIAFQSLKRLLC